MSNNQPTAITNLTFEEAMQELEEIIQSMEKGEIKLDEAIEQYQRALSLHQYCEKKLKAATMKISQINEMN